MGILNITPDSFHDGGKFDDVYNAQKQVEKILSEGADIVDIGAISSQPGAKTISSKEEFARLNNILPHLRKEFPKMIVSLDTYRSGIVKYMYEYYNINMVNDISSGDADNEMIETVAKLKIPYVAMHKKGNPENMQENPNYQNITTEILMYFGERISEMNRLGLNDIILDPGFGFGKTVNHNYELLKNVKEIKALGYPILVGISRKSMIYKVLDCLPKDSLIGTTVLNAVALWQGADILRVHDVKEAVETVKLIEKLKETN